MQKKIYIFNVSAYGHVNPTLALCEELVRRGHDVHYFVAEEFRGVITETGAKFHPCTGKLGSEPPPPVITKEAMAMMPLRLLQEAELGLEQVFAEVCANPPDLILFDSMTWIGPILADYLDVPCVGLDPSYARNEHFTVVKHVLGDSFELPECPGFKEYAANVANKFGVKEYAPQDFMMRRNPLNIVFLSREFQISGETFGSEFEFVGPMLRAGATASGNWDPKKGKDKPIMLISLGTAFNFWPEFYRMCFEAFGDSEWHVVMSIGKWVKADELGSVPANFELHTYLPQLAVLPHVDLFITHGGMNSTQEALWFNKPMVVIPQMMEQETTARRIQSLGLGRFLPKNEVTAVSLKDAVNSVRQDKGLPERLEQFHAVTRNTGGARQAVDAIERSFH